MNRFIFPVMLVVSCVACFVAGYYRYQFEQIDLLRDENDRLLNAYNELDRELYRTRYRHEMTMRKVQS